MWFLVAVGIERVMIGDGVIACELLAWGFCETFWD